jgi:hypothetical protein
MIATHHSLPSLYHSAYDLYNPTGRRLLALLPTSYFDHECYREFGKLEHVSEAELRGNVNTAARVTI